jgi:hypothetical protein
MEVLNEIRQMRKRLDELEKNTKDSMTAEQKVKEKVQLDLKEMVAELDPDLKWKAFVLKTDVVDNIVNILEECYEPYLDFILESHADANLEKAYSIIGKKHSKQWEEFQFCVIKKLLDPKDYDEEYDFEDTAGGCDEVAWDAGCEVITERT